VKLGAEEGILCEKIKSHFTHFCRSGLHKIRRISSEIYWKIAILIQQVGPLKVIHYLGPKIKFHHYISLLFLDLCKIRHEGIAYNPFGNL